MRRVKFLLSEKKNNQLKRNYSITSLLKTIEKPLWEREKKKSWMTLLNLFVSQIMHHAIVTTTGITINERDLTKGGGQAPDSWRHG